MNGVNEMNTLSALKDRFTQFTPTLTMLTNRLTDKDKKDEQN